MALDITSKLENAIFGHRRLVIGLFLVVTAFMGWSASRIGIDAGFTKLLPLEHEYMQTYLKHREEFGGANRLLIALMAQGRRHLHAGVLRGPASRPPTRSSSSPASTAPR